MILAGHYILYRTPIKIIESLYSSKFIIYMKGRQYVRIYYSNGNYCYVEYIKGSTFYDISHHPIPYKKQLYYINNHALIASRISQSGNMVCIWRKNNVYCILLGRIYTFNVMCSYDIQKIFKNINIH